MKLGISEAARRAKVDRKTLYRLMEKGRISKEMTNGKPVIDLSELCRVFPDAVSMDGQCHTETSRSIGQSDTGEAGQVIAAMAERIASLEAEKAALRRDLDHERREAGIVRDRLLAIVERHAESMRLLTDQRDAATNIKPLAKRSLWQRILGRDG